VILCDFDGDFMGFNGDFDGDFDGDLMGFNGDFNGI